MAEVCETGLWADKRTGRVVTSEPEEGHLLVAPGATVTPTIAAQIERARALAPADPESEPEVLEKPADEDEKADEKPETFTVETAAAPPAPETATGASAGRPAGKGRR